MSHSIYELVDNLNHVTNREYCVCKIVADNDKIVYSVAVILKYEEDTIRIVPLFLADSVKTLAEELQVFFNLMYTETSAQDVLDKMAIDIPSSNALFSEPTGKNS